MKSVFSVLQTALPVFLALVLGMLCRRKNIFTRDGIDTLKKVVVNITLPAVLFNAFASAQYTLSTVLLPVIMFVLCFGSLILGRFLIKISGMKSRVAPFLATCFEAGMLGYALFALLFPDVSVSEFAVLDLGQTLFVVTLFKILISGEKDLKAMGKDMASMPMLWGLLAGVLLGATGLYAKLQVWGAADVLDAVTDLISAPTGMIILLTVGYDLVIREIPWKKTGGLLLMRIVVAGLFYVCLLVLNRTVLGGVIFEGAALLLVILPPPYVIPIFADEPAERTQIASVLSASTLLTLIAFAICSVFVNLG